MDKSDAFAGWPITEDRCREFVFHFWFVGWDCISIGIHICPTIPNMEIHLPFGFIRLGWVWKYNVEAINASSVAWRKIGV